MMDFPVPSGVGQRYTSPVGPTYEWDGLAWNIVQAINLVFVSDTPPPNPAPGQQWWRTTNCQMYVWYDDGNSQQWVQSAGAAATPSTMSLWEAIGAYDLSGKAYQDVINLAAYEHLRFRVDASLSAMSSQAYLRVSDDNGVTFKSGGSDYSFSNMVVVAGAVTGYAPANAVWFPLTGAVDANFIMPTVEISSFNKARAAVTKVDTIFFTNASATQRQFPHGYSATQTARNALRVGLSSGTFTNGTLMLEGIRG